MNGTLTRPGARATARVAPTLCDNLAMTPAAQYGRGDPGGRPGLAVSSFYHTTATPAPQDCFATAPMQALWREPDWQREEEAYTSFEAAISNRVLALKERHISAYVETGARAGVSPAVDRLVHRAFALWRTVCARRIWKRGVLLFGAALMLMLIGFDLMGVLVLYAR